MCFASWLLTTAARVEASATPLNGKANADGAAQDEDDEYDVGQMR
jgi:hypothetical protein